MSILLIGASVRAAAWSARRAGWSPTAIDLFADEDTRAVGGATIRIARGAYPEGLEALAGRQPDGPWMYTGGIENEPDLVDRIARERPLWGTAGDALRRSRDPFEVAAVLRKAGLPVLDVRRAIPGTSPSRPPWPTSGEWLWKPLRSTGGLGVQDVAPGFLLPEQPGYFQTRVVGRSMAWIAVGNGRSARSLGATEQRIGRVGAPYAYVGSVGPTLLASATTEALEAIADKLAESLGLRGLFGLDFVLSDGVPYLVEINPRYTASCELLELAARRPILFWHRWGCGLGNDPGPWPGPRDATVLGKAVLFADRPTRARALGPDLVGGPIGFDPPEIADVPAPGTEFEAGDPEMSVFARGSNREACLRALDARLDHWGHRLRDPQQTERQTQPAEGRAGEQAAAPA